MPHLYGLPIWNWTLQVIGVVFSYYGAVLNAKLDVRGFKIWLFSNSVLFALHALTGLWLLCLLDAAYFRINVAGMRQWNEIREMRLSSQFSIPKPG